jgi:hypothetical protein
MSENDEATSDEGLDDVERAARRADEDRGKEQDDADNDVAPRGPTELGGEDD